MSVTPIPAWCYPGVLVRQRGPWWPMDDPLGVVRRVAFVRGEWVAEVVTEGVSDLWPVSSLRVGS